MDELESPHFSECPRCGDHSLEHLESFAHCPNCFYSQDTEFASRPTTLAEIEGLIEELEEHERKNRRRPDETSPEIEFSKAVGW